MTKEMSADGLCVCVCVCVCVLLCACVCLCVPEVMSDNWKVKVEESCVFRTFLLTFGLARLSCEIYSSWIEVIAYHSQLDTFFVAPFTLVYRLRQYFLILTPPILPLKKEWMTIGWGRNWISTKQQSINNRQKRSIFLARTHPLAPFLDPPPSPPPPPLPCRCQGDIGDFSLFDDVCVSTV